MKKLGVNVDHVATVRNARGISIPSPVAAAILAEKAGADNITCHLREDRRHIRDEDVIEIQKVISVPLNLEIAVTDYMVQFAIEHRPEIVTFVPEKREERTTEGGLDLFVHSEKISQATKVLVSVGIEVSLFIEPDSAVIARAHELGITSIELHTGAYSECFGGPHENSEVERIHRAVETARGFEMEVHAGHGLNRENIGRLAKIEGISSFQIGHSIIADSVFVGIDQAVRHMKSRIQS